MNQGFINYNYIDFKILWIDSFGRGVSHTPSRTKWAYAIRPYRNK